MGGRFSCTEKTGVRILSRPTFYKPTAVRYNMFMGNLHITITDSSGHIRRVYRQHCMECGNEFWCPRHRAQKYCSKRCQIDHRIRITNVECTCSSCGKRFLKQQSSLKNSKHGVYFCSRVCKNKAQRMDTPDAGISPPHYGTGSGLNRYRSMALRAYGETCSNPDCPVGKDIPTKMLDVDHIDGDRSNNELDNLQVLCVWCHAEKTRRDWPD